jgi:CubicO group peptidase (beta-lactamase class C family)
MSKDLQDTIQNLLNSFVAEGKQRGIQAVAYVDGKLVVDAWAGVSDVRTGAKVDGDSLFPVFSTTKGIFSTVIHILAERGVLDYDQPIAHYWPEFAANGKETITLRHAMAHTSGVPYMPDFTTLEQTFDWDYMCSATAKLKPVFPPGAKEFYHPVTFGWLLGEVARRASGRTVPQLIADELCRPLGMTQMYCGIPAELEPQTAFLELEPNPSVTPPPPPNDVAPVMMPLHEWINRRGVRLAPQPGCSGIMSARAIAKHYAALLPGGVDGVELLPQSRMKIATEMQTPSEGYAPESRGRRGLGYQLGTDIVEVGYSSRAFGHFGHGGSFGFADPANRLAFSITRNLYNDHNASQIIAREIRAGLGIAEVASPFGNV